MTYQTKCDLDSGYWHLALYPPHRKFVGCHFVLPSGEIIFWVWNVLFLGVKDAVYIFTKILVPHRRYLRSKGIRATMFIDDQGLMAKSFLECNNTPKLHYKLLLKLDG